MAIINSLQNVVLEELPYDYNALEPFIGKTTLITHHDKHHAKYVDNTLNLIKGTDLEHEDLTTIIRSSYGVKQGLFNNAAQSFNHDFYWKSMKPKGGGIPAGELLAQIENDFGSFDAFRSQFVEAANTVFGSGWVWLVSTKQGLKVGIVMN